MAGTVPRYIGVEKGTAVYFRPPPALGVIGGRLNHRCFKVVTAYIISEEAERLPNHSHGHTAKKTDNIKLKFAGSIERTR